MYKRISIFVFLLAFVLTSSIFSMSTARTGWINGLAADVTTTRATIVTSTKSTQIMIAGVVLTVEVAETASAQEKGLSGRSSLPIDHGMLFILPHSGYWSFWMVDMKFPLDIIWFNSTRQVVFTEPNLPPCTPQNCPAITPTVKSMYVLEVNAGFIASHQIGMGRTFVFLDH